MAENTYRVEIGAWVESTTPKASGKGMRKVWVSPTPKGETARLSVIATREGRETHAVTLHVGTVEQRAEAREMLTLALAGLDSLLKAPSAPKAAPKPPTPPKAPTPITRNPAPVKPALASLPKPAPATGRVTSTQAAPADGVSWFATLMHEAGAI